MTFGDTRRIEFILGHRSWQNKIKIQTVGYLGIGDGIT